MAEIIRNMVDDQCCECWKDGCGMNGAFGVVADGLECVSPSIEWCADCIWCLGSPLAFPCIFFFSPNPENESQSQGPGGGWAMAMLTTPVRKPLTCCFATLCPWGGQWMARYQALDGDMTRYRLWQGYHDGPQCCARRCPGAPIVIQSGTYGEDSCPHVFLCLEICCLAGINSLCCSHYVTRRLVREERGLGKDPTEIRQEKCAGFFGKIMHNICMVACCIRVCSCCIGLCAIDSAGGQECSAQGQRASSACFEIAYTLWRGIQSVRLLAMGCMVAQQHYEITDGVPVNAPQAQEMERK